MLPERFCLQRKMPFIKKSFTCKEKTGTIIKVNLVKKIKKHNQLRFGTLVLASFGYCGDNASNMDFFQNPVFKESSNMALKTISE